MSVNKSHVAHIIFTVMADQRISRLPLKHHQLLLMTLTPGGIIGHILSFVYFDIHLFPGYVVVKIVSSQEQLVINILNILKWK